MRVPAVQPTSTQDKEALAAAAADAPAVVAAGVDRDEART
jgi:hypothetical protein